MTKVQIDEHAPRLGKLKKQRATFNELNTALSPVLTAPNKATTLAALGNWAGATAADRSLALLFLAGVAFAAIDYLIEEI